MTLPLAPVFLELRYEFPELCAVRRDAHTSGAAVRSLE